MKTETGQAAAQTARKELHAYAKLLSLRSGRQFEDKTSYREAEDEQSADRSRADGGSSQNFPLGDLDLDSLRREFLDRLSETISSAKGGRYVVASHMFYWPDQAEVFIGINSGFVEGDELSRFMGNLCTALKDIASAPERQTEKYEAALWDTILRHQLSRLNDNVAELRQIMKNRFQHFLPQHHCPQDLKSDVEHFHALGRGGSKLHKAIGFLGRLRTCFRILVAASRQISEFNNLVLVPVVGLKTRKTPLSGEWSLAKTFQALNLQLNDVEIGKLMESSRSKAKWTKNKLLTDFSRLKSPTWEIHAEIQLVLFVLSHPEEVANGKRFDYIGCSRYSCLLCSKFLYFFQDLRTRGCHGKLYNHSWTVPMGDDLGKDEQHILLSAVIKVVSWMRRELTTSKVLPEPEPRKTEVKESTVGHNSTIIARRGEEHFHQSHAIYEHLHRQRAQNAQTQHKNESAIHPVEHEEASESQPHNGMPRADTVELCAGCPEETTQQCSQCGGGWSCNRACGQQMSLADLLKCNVRQVTSADYLHEGVCMDDIPTDPRVQQDYWFDRCENHKEASHLFGVFIGLFVQHPNRITREELHQWRLNTGGNPYLVAKIIEKYEELPTTGRGKYFPWFLKHRARFELPDAHELIPRAPSPTTQMRNMETKARKYLAPEDQLKNIEDLDPFAKRHCFIFYSMAVVNSYPPLMNWEHCHWFDFGFVVTRDEYEERQLGSMYATMLFGSLAHEDYMASLGSPARVEPTRKKLPACSFDEFWRAWERGKLMALFDKCWPASANTWFMESEYDLLDRLRVFLEADAPRPSIWRLRHFLAMEHSIESVVPVAASAAREYGFSERLDTLTNMELRDYYVRLLKKAEPLAVHRERMKGNLLQFAEGYVGTPTPRVKEVLRGLLQLKT